MEHPGYEEAIKHGYELHSFSGDGKVANYTKTVDGGHAYVTINLEVIRVDDKLEAIVSSQYKMVTISIGRISFPHPRLITFENQIIECSPGD